MGSRGLGTEEPRPEVNSALIAAVYGLEPGVSLNTQFPIYQLVCGCAAPVCGTQHDKDQCVSDMCRRLSGC